MINFKIKGTRPTPLIIGGILAMVIVALTYVPQFQDLHDKIYEKDAIKMDHEAVEMHIENLKMTRASLYMELDECQIVSCENFELAIKTINEEITKLEKVVAEWKK